MKKLPLIISILLLYFCSFGQTQKESLPIYTQKGNSYFGFELGLNGSGALGSGVAVIDMFLTPAIKYQYNIINRLSIGGKLSSSLMYKLNNRTEINMMTNESVAASVIVQYYPFKNGFSVEGEMRNEIKFNGNSVTQYKVLPGLNIGYTFLLGKNKLTALGLKMNTLANQDAPEWGRPGISVIPTIGLKLPLGKSKIKRPVEMN